MPILEIGHICLKNRADMNEQAHSRGVSPDDFQSVRCGDFVSGWDRFLTFRHKEKDSQMKMTVF